MLLPQEVGIAIVLHSEVLLFVGRWQRFRDVSGVLEGLAIEKVRIRIWLLAVLGEEGGNEVLLTDLVCLHRWLSEGGMGWAGRPGVGGERESDRKGAIRQKSEQNFKKMFRCNEHFLRQQIATRSPLPYPSSLPPPPASLSWIIAVLEAILFSY